MGLGTGRSHNDYLFPIEAKGFIVNGKAAVASLPYDALMHQVTKKASAYRRLTKVRTPCRSRRYFGMVLTDLAI